VFYPPSEKVQRIDTQEVPIQNWLGDLIFYFKKTVRKCFKPKKKILALWLNQKGKPLGKIIYIFYRYYIYIFLKLIYFRGQTVHQKNHQVCEDCFSR